MTPAKTFSVAVESSYEIRSLLIDTANDCIVTGLRPQAHCAVDSATCRGVTTARNSVPIKLAAVASTSASWLIVVPAVIPRFYTILREVCRKPPNL